jgi:cytochrome c oxidase subunit II
MENKGSGIRQVSERRRRWAITGMIIAMAVVLLPRLDAASAHIPVITIHAKRFRFTPSEINLKQSETVELIFIADDVAHAITVKGLGLDLELPKHKARKVILTPPMAGDFAGGCSRYCGNGHDRMTFVVHVRSRLRGPHH